MFLKLDSMERGEEKDFVLNTLLHEFDDIVKEARKIFARYGYLGSYRNVHYSFLAMSPRDIRCFGRQFWLDCSSKSIRCE